MDEAFWARKEGPAGVDEDAPPQGDYDANFFQDDGLPLPGGIDDDDEILAVELMDLTEGGGGSEEWVRIRLDMIQLVFSGFLRKHM